MAYTPKPWGIGVERLSSVTITGAKTTYIATLSNRPGWWKDMAANAHLIIAAPDLLDACRALLAAGESAMMIDWYPAREQARAAIANAMGDGEEL